MEADTAETKTEQEALERNSVMPSDYEPLRPKTQETLTSFLHTQLETGLTFVRNAGQYAKARQDATKIAELVRRYTSQVTDGYVKDEIDRKLAELDRLIAEL